MKGKPVAWRELGNDAMPFLNCHLLTPTLFCGFMCTRYGFNSHGLSVVEHRLRARQQKQSKLTAGKARCCGKAFLPPFERNMAGNMGRARDSAVGKKMTTRSNSGSAQLWGSASTTASKALTKCHSSAEACWSPVIMGPGLCPNLGAWRSAESVCELSYMQSLGAICPHPTLLPFRLLCPQCVLVLGE